jgi:chromosome segregation ATPase
MPRKDKTSIPGVAEVPMPPAAPAPRAERELQLEITTDKTGVRIKVGAAWAVTLFPRDLRRIGPMLGMDYAKAINERNELNSALVNRTQERDLARGRFSDFHQHLRKIGIPLRNTGDFVDDAADLHEWIAAASAAKGDLVARTEELAAERRLVANLRTDNEQIGKERDQAQKEIEHLRGELDLAADLNEKIDALTLERDAAIVDRDTWKQNAERDAADLIALADKLNQATQKLRDIEKLRESDTIEMGATILGYRILAVVVFVVVAAIAISKGVGR